MANISSYAEMEILDWLLEISTATDVYVGIVDDTATNAELEGGDLTNEITSYTGDRKVIDFTTPVQVSGKGTVENNADIDFEGMPAVTVGYAVIMDSQSADGTGNVLYWVPADNIKTTNSGDTYRIPSGELVLDLD